MKENHYYVVTDSNFKEHIVRFIKKENDKSIIYDVKDKEERKLNSDIKYYEAPLTYSHLNKLGFTNTNFKYFPIDGKYIFPLNGIGSNENGLSCLLLGFSVVPEREALSFLGELQEMIKEFITDEGAKKIQKKFNSSYSINNVLDNFNFDINFIDSILTD